MINGSAPAGEALLIYLGGRAVGGGVANTQGAYSVPIRVQERPGVYPVEARLRASRAIVGRFTCYVDVPVGAAEPSPTEGAPPAATPRATATQAATPIRPTVASPTTLTATAGTPSPTATGPTATATTTGTPGPSPTPTNTLQPGAATQTPTPAARANDVQIAGIILADPTEADSDEYVKITNFAARPVNMTGWRLINATRPEILPFTFPNFTLRPDVTIVVWTDDDTNNLEAGDFFWNRARPIWRSGDRGELRDAQNNLIHSFTALGQS